MRGMSNGGSGGGMVDTILKIAPIGCSFIAFLFMAIALSSAMKPGYIEGISIINFNMSTLGKNLVKAPDISGQAKDGCGKAGDAVDDTVNKAGDFVNGIFVRRSVGDVVDGACNKGAEVADKAVQLGADAINKALGSIAKAIGIKEYYSVHIGTLCEGEYKPLFSDKDAEPDVQKCTKKFYTGQTDLSKKLDEGLQVGPFKFRLSDLELVDEIQSGFDKIPKALATMAFFFLFAVFALVAGFLCACAVLAFEYFMHGMRNIALFAALGCIGLGWLTSFIGAAAVTGVAESIKKAVNKHSEKFGMSAATSPGLYVLLWGSVLFSAAALGLLVLVFLRTRKGAAENDDQDKDQSSSMEDSHGFARMPTEGRGGGGRGRDGGGKFTEEPL